jgi:hypothetical protein
MNGTTIAKHTMRKPSLSDAIRTLLVLMSLTASYKGFAHGGRVIESGSLKGCHNKTADGSFHCHTKSNHDGESWSSKKIAIKAIEKDKPSQKVVKPTLNSHGNLTPYKREEFWGHWADQNHDCKDTRAEVLIRESSQQVKLRKSGCTVDSGKWVDFYTGETLTSASNIEIDHVVPVKHAYNSGANTWSYQKRREFYLDNDNLVITSQHNNRSKGMNDFTTWHPVNHQRACEYATKWFRIKKKYGLRISVFETNNLNLLKCERQNDTIAAKSK